MADIPQETIQIHRDQLRERLLPRLTGRVFHVTPVAAAHGILDDGEIRPNHDGRYPFTFGQSQHSYFRKHGCVCLFDLRTATADQIDMALMKFFFLNPWRGNKPVFFVLGESLFDRLVSSAGIGLPAMLVPHVEAGHPGPIAVENIDEVLWVEVDDPGPEPGTMAHLVWLAGQEDDDQV